MSRSITLKALYGVECPNNESRWYCFDEFEACGTGWDADEYLGQCSGFTMDQDGGEGREVHYDDLPKSLQNALWSELNVKLKAAREKYFDENPDERRRYSETDRRDEE